MEKSNLTEVKAILKSLVLSCPEKITVEQLNRDYRNVEGQYIPYRQLGYVDLEKFLHSIPDTLRVFGSGPTAMVCFVANEKSDHIHDMIMRQKKPKSNARKNPRSLNRNTNHFLPKCNKINQNSQRPAQMKGQQLSPYQNVNRNYMTKTIQVRDLPNFVPAYNYVPTFLPIQTLNTFPQPNGIFINAPHNINPVLSTIKNGIVKALNNQQDQRIGVQVSQISNFMKNQCIVSNPPPPLPRQQNKSVKFSPENDSIQILKETEIQSSKKESKSFTETTNLIDSIKSPTVKKQIPIKLSEEVENLLAMPKLRRVNNPIEDGSLNSASNQRQKEDNIQIEKLENRVKTTQSQRFFDDSSDQVEDPDEAVPSFAAKNNVFRLDFPENTVPYGFKIPPYNLPDECTVGSYIKIFISEIHNPFKFWFHIHKENHELDSLMHRIERFYSSIDSEDMRISINCLIPGQVCAASYNGLWHRAEIVAPPVIKTIKVSFMDYGTVTDVEIENVKFLPFDFAQLPAQALRGCLSHIKPREYHWSHEATTYFLTVVTELMLYAKITEIDTKKSVFYMILCDTNGDEDVQINKLLVDKRYASYNEDWKTEKIKQNNGKRLRHPREDFPTFSMIELGEYPSFPELVSLQQRGIDYETIYDQIIYNQSTILNKHESASEGLRNLPYFLTTSNPFRSEILLELYASTSKAI